MDFDDLNQGEGLMDLDFGTTDKPETEQATDKFETMKDGDVEYVKVPKENFEALRQTALRGEGLSNQANDLALRQKETETLYNQLSDAIKYLDNVVQEKGLDKDGKPQQLTQKQASDALQQGGFDPGVMDKINALSEQMRFVSDRQQEIEVQNAMTEINREKEELSRKFPDAFSDPSKSDKIMTKVMERASQTFDRSVELYNRIRPNTSYENWKGVPISLEKAFKMEYADTYIGTVNAARQKEAARRTKWGTPEPTVNKAGSRPIKSWDEAQSAALNVLNEKL